MKLQLDRNLLYRDNYRRLVKYLLAMLVLTVILLVALIMMIISQPRPRYFATTTTGRVVPMQSLSMPVVTSRYILQWASIAARKAYNLDFVNYEKELAGVKPYFTNQGWQQFNAALTRSSLIQSILANKLTMSAVVYKPPVISSRLEINGRYTWRVEVPLLITYNSASEKRQRSFVVSMDIMRMPVLEISKGIAINSFKVGGFTGKSVFN